MFLINDLFDLPYDKAAGKSNPLESFSTQAILLLISLPLFAGVSILLLKASTMLGIVILLAFLLATAYSAPIVRLKARGLWGLLADSIMEKPITILVIYAYLIGINSDAIILAILSESLQMMTVLKQQIDDYEGDLRSGTRTFAVQVGKRFASKLHRDVFQPLNVAAIIAFSLFLLLRTGTSGLGVTLAWAVILIAGSFLRIWSTVDSNAWSQGIARFTKLAEFWYNSKGINFWLSYLNVNFEGVVTLVVGISLARTSLQYIPLLILFICSQFYYGGFYKVLLTVFLKAIRHALPNEGRKLSGNSHKSVKWLPSLDYPIAGFRIPYQEIHEPRVDVCVDRLQG